LFSFFKKEKKITVLDLDLGLGFVIATKGGERSLFFFFFFSYYYSIFKNKIKKIKKPQGLE